MVIQLSLRHQYTLKIKLPRSNATLSREPTITITLTNALPPPIRDHGLAATMARICCHPKNRENRSLAMSTMDRVSIRNGSIPDDLGPRIVIVAPPSDNLHESNTILDLLGIDIYYDKFTINPLGEPDKLDAS
ncbi:hypothetical protein AruPA_02770 [Acidiphilium sp. PA]|uniref:hypothetical protein n=1 Tax=Acidiphilium sp. PA TaxID=2871705 RepID=UPI002243F6D5|nr:hypothetical protein [Acidiphilium sp. PA]MCW8305947.1 hypothetical protein [Acidiphilium sp. PA]